MLMGILWPHDLDEQTQVHNKLKRAEFMYKAVMIEYKGEVYHLTFNAHHLFNISFKLFGQINPMMKARKELLVDIQHWFSRQMSRPGKTEF